MKWCGVINSCIREITWGDKVYNKVDMTKKEISDFVDSLNKNSLKTHASLTLY